MPCWFFDKKDLKNTPSLQDGIDPDTEARYRREGARFIVDTGTKMGLRYDTCATGVVYFHRFYLFYSFKQFHRYITAAACLFLAGKVEETPKKCKDIIKTAQGMLSETQFLVFGEDPKEEVMTMERIILQTIRFDLQVEHPYSYLLRFAKLLKGDHAKMQKMVQMAWTFVNDSLCTTLCLQYESDLISVALLYLASRLSKLEVQDWHGRTPDSKIKWFEALVEDANIELLEDVCHQVLDLYSATGPKKTEVSPPPPAPGRLTNATTPVPHQSRQQSQAQSETKSMPAQVPPTRQSTSGSYSPSAGKKIEVAIDTAKDRSKRYGEDKMQVMHHPAAGQGGVGNVDYSSYNPFMPSQMYSSSFMSGEGAQSIQTLMGGNPVPPGDVSQKSMYAHHQQQYMQPGAYDSQATYSYAAYPQAPGSQQYSSQQQQAPVQQYGGGAQAQYMSQQQPQYLPPQYAQAPSGNQYVQQYSAQQQQYPSSAYQQQQQPYQASSSYASQPNQQVYSQQPPAVPPQSYSRSSSSKPDRHEPAAPGLPTVRITSRPR